MTTHSQECKLSGIAVSKDNEEKVSVQYATGGGTGLPVSKTSEDENIEDDII